MLLNCTLKDGLVYLPTVAKTEAGFYLDREPVSVVCVANTDALRRALVDLIMKGNATIPTPKGDAYPPPVLPRYAGAKNSPAGTCRLPGGHRKNRATAKSSLNRAAKEASSTSCTNITKK